MAATAAVQTSLVTSVRYVRPSAAVRTFESIRGAGAVLCGYRLPRPIGAVTVEGDVLE